VVVALVVFVFQFVPALTGFFVGQRIFVFVGQQAEPGGADGRSVAFKKTRALTHQCSATVRHI